MEKIIKGDILINKWGYEKTNIICYQVITRTEKMVYIKEISKSIVNGGKYYKDSIMPNKDSYIGEEIRKKIIVIDDNEYIKMDNYFMKWNGEKLLEKIY